MSARQSVKSVDKKLDGAAAADSKKSSPVIALLGQPNSGKSSLFNVLTGSRQHVGNWPGKTIAQKEGFYKRGGVEYTVADLPGSYSLTAESEEEVITRNYIMSGKADLVIILADASQLNRSLYMLADYAGSKVPAMLLLNMMDVAEGQGLKIDTEKLAQRIGIPVVPFVAIDKKGYGRLLETIDRALLEKPVLNKDKMPDAKARFEWIDQILDGVITSKKEKSRILTKFDRAAIHPVWGKFIAVGIVIVIFIFSMLFMGLIAGVGMLFPKVIGPSLRSAFVSWNVHPVLISLVCDVLTNAVYLAFMMMGFVFGVTLGFYTLEEVGYLARVSFLYDHTMSKIGLQGKAIMPFFMGLGCTIASASGSRVIDNWGQRILTIALAWAIPCGATWGVVPSLAMSFFGVGGGTLVVLSIIAFMFLFIGITARILRPRLSPKETQTGMIMELPPYHKPHFKNLLQVTLMQAGDIFLRALRVISLVSIVFFVLAYPFSGRPGDSILHRVGTFIEPVTRFFGLGWKTFMAFLASMISKESILGVLNTLFTGGGEIVSATFNAKLGTGADIATLLSENISKLEALAFMFAITFNMPCVIAFAATAREAHSVKWTLKIALYYTVAALIISSIFYHIGLLIW